MKSLEIMQACIVLLTWCVWKDFFWGVGWGILAVIWCLPVQPSGLLAHFPGCSKLFSFLCVCACRSQRVWSQQYQQQQAGPRHGQCSSGEAGICCRSVRVWSVFPLFYFFFFFFFLITQMETLVFRVVHHRSSRLPKSFLATGGSPSTRTNTRGFLFSVRACSRCSVVLLLVWQGQRADWPVLNLVKKGQCKQLLPVCFLTFVQTLYFSRSRDSLLVKCWTRDWKVASSNPGWSGGKIFLSRDNCRYWLLFGVRSTPFVIAVACKRPWSFCQKCRWQVTPKHAYIVDPMMWEWADYAAVQA